VTVGNLIARKRQADVIEAVALLRDRCPALRYVIVGDGPEREALRALAAARGVADRVELRGRLPHAEAVAVARQASLFVLPSVAEAFGVGYVEAMAAGVPVIGSRGEDGPEEIAAAGGGIELVAPGDPPALAAAVQTLLDDPSRLSALRVAARETVEREFTWERCGRETVAAYEEVLRG
jgi:glycosyltransferase involved in cell wall biosynthesis